MRAWHALLTGFLLLGSVTSGAQDLNDAAKSWLANVESRQRPVFMTRCSRVTQGTKEAQTYTATLIIEAGSEKAKLIEAEDGYVVNIADVDVGHGGLVLRETNGGVYSYARVEELVSELAGGRFHLLAPFRAADVQKLPATQSCREQ